MLSLPCEHGRRRSGRRCWSSAGSVPGACERRRRSDVGRGSRRSDRHRRPWCRRGHDPFQAHQARGDGNVRESHGFGELRDLLFVGGVDVRVEQTDRRRPRSRRPWLLAVVGELRRGSGARRTSPVAVSRSSISTTRLASSSRLRMFKSKSDGRSWYPILRMSPKPLVVTNATFAPLRSSRALVARVVPRRTSISPMGSVSRRPMSRRIATTGASSSQENSYGVPIRGHGERSGEADSGEFDGISDRNWVTCGTDNRPTS